MKKVKIIALIIALILVSSVVTFSVSNLFYVKSGDEISLSIEEYEALLDFKIKYHKVEQLEEFINKNYYKDIPLENLEDGVLYGLFESLGDPYSEYMNEFEFTKFNEQSAGAYGGIGIIVSPGDANLITIVSPIEDTPGEKAGLKTGDFILEADGIEVFADEMDAAIKIIKGEPNTPVELKIMREDEMFTVSIVRELIKLKSVKSRVIEEKYGVLRITIFDEKVSEEFSENLQELLDQDIEGLIIDLRNNPGGSLREVVDIADKLLGEQLIVYTEDRAGQTKEYKSDENKLDLPIVVLVNGGSASASEILTAAIKDSNSGVIVGTTTFGKGLVQSVIPYGDGSGMKLTTSQYYTPNGDYIHGIGIAPNIIVEIPETYFEIEEPTDADDPQLQKAIEILKK